LPITGFSAASHALVGGLYAAAQSISFIKNQRKELELTDLWDFALRLYAQPGVEPACLRLQAGGADVCLLLCAAWLDRRGVACDAARVQQLRKQAEPWQRSVTTQLRQLRQEWKSAAQGDAQLTELREQLKRLELQAEQVVLQRLGAIARAWPSIAGETDMVWLRAIAGETADPAALASLHQAAASLARVPHDRLP
jgi:uncharacterized protein (TIGR02444 family)